MRSHQVSALRLALLLPATLLVTAAWSADAHRKGPPWISIEYPANPLDPSTRGAYLLVHAFHHDTPVQSPVRGTAEGLIGGERKSVALRFDTTPRPGVYALRKQWSDEGVWSLVITLDQHGGSMAQALVELGPEGITAVRVPTRVVKGWTVPQPIATQEIEESLSRRATRMALKNR